MTLNAAEQFFYDHAGFSVRVSEGETTEEGHIRCARELAVAEQWAREHRAVVEWEFDDDAPFLYDEKGPFYGCIVIVDDANESLWGIAFKDHGGPEDDPYARVVVAELTDEIMRRVIQLTELDAYMDACYGRVAV